MLKNNFDVIVVGGGVIGCAVLKKLSEYNLSVGLIEMSNDVSKGASRANSGLVHAGFDCKPKTLKAQFNVMGNLMFENLCHELSVDLKTNGALVTAGAGELDKLEELMRQGEINKVSGLEILDYKKVHDMEKNLNKNIKYALLAKSAKIVSPYLLTVALAESAVLNGAEICFNTSIKNVAFTNGRYVIETSNPVVGKIYTDFVINACGAFTGLTNDIFGAEHIETAFRKGEYYLLDLTEKDFISHTIYGLPDNLGKGVLITPTIDGNILIGPTSTFEKEPLTDVTNSGLDFIKAKADKISSSINYQKTIRVYAGVRACVGDDFLIKRSDKILNYIYIAGINSPGLTAAPAIAEYVFNLLNINLIKKNLKDIKLRKPYTETRKMDVKSLNALIAKNPDYGEIVCRCERITKGEIIEALNSCLEVDSADAVKRRVRAGGGRCQGGFCTAKIMKIISEYKNIPMTKITKDGTGTEIAPYTI